MFARLAPLALVACIFDTDGDAPISQCEAVCDWAVSCHAAERPVDAAALMATCLDATRDASSSCERADAGDLGAAATAALRTCVNAVEANATASECGAFTGSIDQIKSATPPAECAGTGTDAVDVFAAAQDATVESGDALCARVTESFCETTTRCVLGADAEVPSDVVDALGGTPAEVCAARMTPVFTASCLERDLYAAETQIEEVNAPRQAARECMDTLPSTACDGLLSTEPQAFVDSLDPLCLGVASTPEDLLNLAEVLVDLAEEIAEAAESLP